ncbi:anti-phage dCTP deaminase [Aequorivita viscosa]|nr:anti-phage dCTP deaminase [Aequorivita viscosa]
MEEARKLKPEISKNNRSDKSTSERVKETHTAEVVFGICCQIGSLKENVIDSIEKSFTRFGYTVKKIKLREFIDSYITNDNYHNDKTPEFNEYIKKIETGNELRNSYGNDFLANLAITKIATDKIEKFGIEKPEDVDKVESQRICYIIDSIKHTSELSTFRDVYQGVFYLLSVYTPYAERVKNLSEPNITINEAKQLITIDQFEDLPNDNGQQVRKVFIDADFFIRVEGKKKKSEIQKKIDRYVNLIFEYGVETPTIIERAMYEAKSASVNSACLSRQVGASIITKSGELISTGWNDVPKYGGNLYTSSDINDNRCFKTGICHNDHNKSRIKEFIKNEFQNKLDNENLVEIDNIRDKITTLLDETLEESSIKSLIEFSRSVHAEMHAIINAGKLNGEKIKGGILFCTTYPCHNCARHIIAAGIEKVYYIEPYIKSKAPELHKDSITENENEENKVQILLFDGVSPRRYLSFFKMTQERKENGRIINREKVKDKIYPINSIPLKSLFVLETKAAERVKEKQSGQRE